MTPVSSISWTPPWVSLAAAPVRVLAGARETGSGWQCRTPLPGDWPALGEGLRRAQLELVRLPVARIVAAIDEVSRRWGSRAFPPRRAARDEVVAATGFSAEAVERSFDVELRNYRADSLLRTLRRELGSPGVVDGFVPDRALRGETMAIGPRVTLCVFTGNVPGLPALSLVRALLVKSAVIAKVASGEPTFAARFVDTLHEVEPALGDAILVTYWDRADVATLDGALAQSDAVIAYGGDDACAAVRARVSAHQRYVEHGHKLSAGIISAAYLEQAGAEEVARRIAVDVSTFNQQACIAPQAYLVEGPSAATLARAVAQALADYARACPLGVLEERDAAALQLRRSAAAWAAAVDPGHDVWQAPGLDWTVTLERTLLPLDGGGNRVVRMVPVESVQAAIEALRPVGRHLQNVGLGVRNEEIPAAAVELARIGACRLSEPGRMAEPSLIWRHDGQPCLAQLVRWCDIEMHQEAASPRARLRGWLKRRIT